jgi:DNA-binding response OmpR family regulator
VHILIIDDEPPLLELMRELLEGEGFVVSTRCYADPNLGEIKRLAPDLIVLDHLRRGHADWSLLQALKQDLETHAIPIVLCTGATREVEVFAAELAAMDVAVALKPFDISVFIAVIQAALRSRQFPQRIPLVHDRSPGHPHHPPILEMAAECRHRTEPAVRNRPTTIGVRRHHDENTAVQTILARASASSW